ncbi:MAG: hypothetical protein HYS34_09085 [Acidobacteria bacterium]|nr:hypothetical protein [Acidobacteriota bacterium]
MLPLLAVSADAAGDRDVLIGSVLARASEKQADLEAAAGRGAGETLSVLAGADVLPVPCATPLLRALLQSNASVASQGALTAVTERPALEGERVALTDDGGFAVHYPATPRSSGLLSIDRDRNGNPDLVDRVSEALSAARSLIVSRLGLPAPRPDGGRLDIYLGDVGHGVEGYAVPSRPAAAPFVVLDAGLSADRVVPATLHQVAHLSLLSLAERAPLWWDEASAAFLALMGGGDLRAHEAAFRARLQSPGRGLAADGLMLMEGSLLWPLFLAESAGDPSVVRLAWEEMPSVGNDPLVAIDEVLRRLGRSLADAHREFAAWNLFTGERDDGQHYSIGRSLPAAGLAAAGPETPFHLEPAGPLEPLGAAAFRIPGDGRRGSMDLEIAAEGGRPAADLLIFYRGGPSQPLLVPVVFEAAGTGRISVPSGDVRETWIVLRNDALPGAGGEARFELRGSADPYAPYDLASFAASGSEISILLDWTTASERDLAGWNIYRSETPSGPFTRLNSVAVPAVGDSVSDTGYIFVDDFVRPGRRYYYLLEGLTRPGLPQRSQVVSARLPASR